MKRLIFSVTAAVVACTMLGHAQNNNSGVNKYLQYNYDKRAVAERKVIPYPPLREADVLYAKRVQRVIDTREKKNMIMNWPINPFNKLLFDLTSKGADKKGFGKLKMYRTDSLDKAMTIEDFEKIGGSCESVQIPNPLNPDDPYDMIDTTICTPFDPMNVNRFMVYEEWVFDKQRGMFFPRIIAIAPLFKQTIGGVELAERPMFYVSFEELRPIIINEEVFNRQNDAMRQTYYDFFEQRLFSSYITKESNMYDMAINQMPEFKDNPMEALYESERIREDLFNFEHDMWEY
jgi:gliding motility associated protien GldN